MHPDTTILSLDTGHARDYSPGKPYGDYFASEGLIRAVPSSLSRVFDFGQWDPRLTTFMSGSSRVMNSPLI